VTAGIRPEALVPAADGLPFTVEGIEQLGSQTLLIGALGAHRVRAMMGRRDDIALGERIALAAPGSALHLFDPATGERRGTAQTG